MLLNYSALRLAPNIVTPPKSNVNVNSILGLAPSQYEGLQKVGDTGYYYGDNKMYEPYTPSPVQYGRQTIFGFQPIPSWHYASYNSGPFGMSGISTRGGAVSGTITRDGQSFKPVSADITGFSKSKIGDTEQYEYAPSMSYVYSQAPKYQGNPQLASSPAINLTTPTANVYNGNYGAGRFLNTGNLLGFNFGTPSGQTAGGQTTT